MSTYKTKNPLGSAAVKDLYDNAENVDKFVNDRTKEELEDRLGVLRKTWHGMEMIFSRFIDYITGRGEQAVAAIGWQELGNWAVGLAVDNRQQIVYYNGSWYKYLGELEHVIAGDSPENDGGVWSAENPTGKWSNIGDAALRANLGSGDGLKWVGKCHSAIELRSIEPTYDGQSITLARTSASGPLVNAVLTYDASDSTTADDGYSVFVTPNGARWKTDVSKGVDVRLHENIKADGSNIGSVINDIQAKEVQKIVAARSVNAANRLIIIPAKFINDAAMDLLLDEGIKKCSLFYIVFKGDVALNYEAPSGVAVDIDNTYYYNNYGLSGWDIGLVVHQHTGCFKSDGGTIHIKGAMHDGIVAGTITAGNAPSSAHGLKYGNTSGSDVSTDILNV
ncbi:hypothetical protein RAF41_20510, partial [Klebsiella variicola subsp. variicola]